MRKLNLALLAVFISLVVLVMAACHGKVGKLAWAGVYVNVARSEYSVADDTLTLSLLKDGNYSVLRSTGYQSIRDGKLLPKRLQSERFRVVLVASGRELSEPLNGRVYHLDDSGGLLVGQVVYRRVN